MVKDLKYVKIYSVNPFWVIFSQMNEINKNKYLMLVHTNESKKYKELWSKTRDLIRPITKSSWLLWKIYRN